MKPWRIDIRGRHGLIAALVLLCGVVSAQAGSEGRRDIEGEHAGVHVRSKGGVLWQQANEQVRRPGGYQESGETPSSAYHSAL